MKIPVSLQPHQLYLLQYVPLYLCLLLICHSGLHVGENCYLTTAIEMCVKTFKNAQLLQYFNLRESKRPYLAVVNLILQTGIGIYFWKIILSEVCEGSHLRT